MSILKKAAILPESPSFFLVRMMDRIGDKPGPSVEAHVARFEQV